MSFQVNQPNLENMQQYLSKEKSNNQRGDGPRWWSLPAGMSSIRILPPWDPKGMVALPVFMHPIEYQEKDMKYKKYNWTCVQNTFGKPCKICEGLQEMQAAGVDISKYEANRRQFYMNVIVMYDPVYQADISSGKKPEDASGVAPGTHVLMRTPKTVYDWVLSQITNPMVGDITSLTNGIDVYITKEGTGLGTSYTPTLSPNGRTAVPQEYLDKIESLYDLDEIFSTGFDDELIGRLVSSLKRSAGVLQNNVPNVVAGMAGYQPVAPNNPVPSPLVNTPVPSNPMPSAGNPYGNTDPSQFTAPAGAPANFTPSANSPMTNFPSSSQTPVAPAVAPSPYQVSGGTQQSIPNVPPQNSEPVAPVNTPVGDSVPKCYGNYNPSNVACVVCSYEVDCTQKSKG